MKLSPNESSNDLLCDNSSSTLNDEDISPNEGTKYEEKSNGSTSKLLSFYVDPVDKKAFMSKYAHIISQRKATDKSQFSTVQIM